MIANFHTHTTFCDGKHTPEEIILAALEKGFSAIGFSGHGYTAFDVRYCMTDHPGYIAEIKRLKEKYKKDIQVYLGFEEDALYPVDRSQADYIIGSSHYIHAGEQYYSVDSGFDYLQRCLAAFDGDVLRMAESYYSTFCNYIHTRKPEIIGHFDLITKYEEQYPSLFLDNPGYRKIAETYIASAAESGSIFEVNMGAMARGLRTSPYPADHLLYVLKKLDANLILSSDSHHIDTLDFCFEDVKNHLRDLGFTHLCTLDHSEFIKYSI